MPDLAYQITFDCADPDRMARYWTETLRYDLEGPLAPYETWGAYWSSLGVPADEVGDGYDSIVDPIGIRSRIWFQQVPEAKSRKNRLHFDLLVGSGRRCRLPSGSDMSRQRSSASRDSETLCAQ
jgi:hypothetical protein